MARSLQATRPETKYHPLGRDVHFPSRKVPNVRRFLVRALAPIAVVGAVALARADVLHLRDGRTFEGRVEADAEKNVYTVTTPSGVVAEFPADQVKRVERAETAFDAFERRLRDTDRDDREALVRLLAWTREKRLRTPSQRVAEMVLRLDPNHELARRTLGWVVFENRWVLESELRKNHGERGLVKFRGEWMSEAEKDRRLLEDAKREVHDLFENVASKNRHLQELAVSRLMAFRHPGGREIFARWLDDPREIVRIVAVSALTNFAAEDSDRKSDPDAARITRGLFDRLLEANSRAEVDALYLALRLFQPRESFAVALEFLRGSASGAVGDEKRSPLARERAEEVVFRVLRKDWVPELCRAVVAREGNDRREVPGVRNVLRRALGVDQGYDPEKWLSWWKDAAGRFTDQD